MSRTTVVLTDELQAEAKEYGVNVSEECRDAVAVAVAAAKQAREYGEDFETIRATRPIAEGREGELDEKVEFFGRPVFTDESIDTRYYVTPSRNVAWVTEDGYLYWTDDVSDLSPGAAYQELARALGEVPSPTFLDI